MQLEPGWLDTFVEVQRTALPGLGSQIPGLYEVVYESGSIEFPAVE